MTAVEAADARVDYKRSRSAFAKLGLSSILPRNHEVQHPHCLPLPAGPRRERRRDARGHAPAVSGTTRRGRLRSPAGVGRGGFRPEGGR